ncbi:hypothetical protein [Bacillus pumilus]|uniref:hypothetical protein n=1 Tax=Bacillus pumilus TaxID=1408 RepID=UPI001C2356BB|nr:hypothetical protein [Bacillus pumilus]MBU8607853.1 hypothetical protein [Bacillus pumilus]
MKGYKCRFCGLKNDYMQMKCYSKPTGKYNKNGSEKMARKYVHLKCDEEYKNNEAFKEKELKELDELFTYLKKLHRIDTLDGRMMEKIQDLRNGTVVFNKKKIKRYKEGVPFRDILYTYEVNETYINKTLSNMVFAAKWNEFSYVFAIVINNINDSIGAASNKETVMNRREAIIDNNLVDQTSYSMDETAKYNNNKKDVLDISEFL